MGKLDPGHGWVCVPAIRWREEAESLTSISNPLSLTHSAPSVLTWEDLGSHLRTCFPSALGTEQCYRTLIVMDREPETGYWARLLVSGPWVHRHIRKMFSWLPFLASLPSHGPLLGAFSLSLGPLVLVSPQILLPTLSTQFQL